jgi:hypothetical protein
LGGSAGRHPCSNENRTAIHEVIARRLEELNEGMGLSTPRLITPYQLYPWEEPT